MMSGAQRIHVTERITRELIEADVEIAFNLIDLSHAELESGDQPAALHALHDAEDVFRDIERRLVLIGDVKSQPFASLVDELRRQMGLAKSQIG
jgi:hypothetical protein